MELAELTRRAVEVRVRFAAAETDRGGPPWSRAELAQGFAGDVGALMKLVMARRAGAKARLNSTRNLPTNLRTACGACWCWRMPMASIWSGRLSRRWTR